jgi:acetyl-CoA carboxylase carboxyl transferase subunit alpha
MADSKSHDLDFEKPILDVERRIEDLEKFQQKAGVQLGDEIARLREEAARLKKDIFARLTPWQRVILSRDAGRPDAVDYLGPVFDDFVELHGDRAFGDDKAVLAGLARVGGRRVMLIAQRKGKNTKERVTCNFGSPHPEGYRKALEKMKLAEKFRLPVITLVNTPGAYPGLGAEERGQAHIIAKNLLEMTRLRTPVLSIVIGEGGSGGALGICVADRLCILENAYLSVISPEGCAAILWRDSAKAPLAAELLRLVPQDLLNLGVVDEIIPEPLGGAHRNAREMFEIVKGAIVRMLDELEDVPVDKLLDRRYEKYRKIGAFVEAETGKLAATQA